MASTFALWQSIISDPNLTRKLASQVVIFEFGMLITGEDRQLAARHSILPYTHHISIGTYFGPKSEYDALGFQDKLAQNATVKVVELQDWLGLVGHWAETEGLKLIGSVVSCRLPYRTRTGY